MVQWDERSGAIHTPRLERQGMFKLEIIFFKLYRNQRVLKHVRRRGEMVVDGPSETLLAFMAGHGYQAPEDWRGYRELTEK